MYARKGDSGRPQAIRRGRAAFTLLEIMIVVAIIGLLAAIAIPAFAKARREALITRFVNDLNKAVDAFEMYAMEKGVFPPDANRGVIPAGMAEYLPKMDWTAATPLGGRWDWERNTMGIQAGVSVVEPSAAADMIEVDRRLDDGDVTSGKFRQIQSDRYTYVIAE